MKVEESGTRTITTSRTVSSMTSNAALNHRISGSKSLPDPAIEFHEEVFDIGGRSVIIGKAEAMNPTWRPTMEDVSVTHAPGTWGAEPDLAFFGLYDGHGGKNAFKDISLYYCPRLTSASR